MKDERKFKEVIRAIKDTEKDKDKFLKVSHLERRERKPMEFETVMVLAMFGTIWLGMILFFISTL